jgi:hypothetical protein
LNLTSPDRRWDGSTYAGTGYANLLGGAASWPATGVAGTWLEQDREVEDLDRYRMTFPPDTEA